MNSGDLPIQRKVVAWLKVNNNHAISSFALSSFLALLMDFGIKSRALDNLQPQDLVRIAEDCKRLDDQLTTGQPLEWDKVSSELRILATLPLTSPPTICEFGRLHQIFSYLKKVKLDRSDLEGQYAQDYIARECSEPVIDQELLQRLSTYARKRIPSKVDMEVIPVKHGPGAVAERKVKTLEDKLKLNTHDSRIDYMMRWTGRDPVLYALCDPQQSKVSSRVARVLFVPKTTTKLRVICAEPALLQYWQQGLRVILNKMIRRHFPGIKYWDRNLNRKMAMYGSKYHRDADCVLNMATIDLSSASDSVLVSHVKALFGHNHALLGWLLATRSTHSRMPDGQVLPSRKFSPMGSGVCFPILSLVCALITELALHDEGLDRNYYGAFGDDIVCPASVATRVCAYLMALGFSVNTAKSFVSGPFRESCGGDFYEGANVTPIYFRYDPGASTPKQFSSLASFHARASDRGYGRLKTWIFEMASSRLPSLMKAAFFDPNSESCFRSYNPINAHLKQRWNRKYQRREYLATTIVAIPDVYDSEISQIYKYQQIQLGNIQTSPLPVELLPCIDRQLRYSPEFTPYSALWFIALREKAKRLQGRTRSESVEMNENVRVGSALSWVRDSEG
jgi:hypothetical protein